MWVGRLRFEGQRYQLSTAKGEAECRRMLRALVRSLERGEKPAEGRRTTLRQAAEAWLAHQSLSRPATAPGSRTYLRGHLLGDPKRRVPPHPLASKRLVVLSAADLSALYRERLQAGYAPSTVRQLHQKLRACLRFADLHITPVPRGVLSLTGPAAPPVPRLQLSPAQVGHLFRDADARTDPLACLWRLLYYGAVRLGEGLGLAWSAVDLGAALVRIERNLTTARSADGAPVYRYAKTERSRALVPIPPSFVEALVRHHRLQRERAVLLGGAWDEHGLVFDRGDGRPLTHGQAERAFYKALSSAGLPRCRPHDLRGASGSALRNAGHDLVDIQRRLRHADIATTVSSYLQPSSEADRRASETLERLLGEG